MELRLLTGFEEKQQTRALYEEAFDDPPAFTDYYYREKCMDNRMIVLTEGGRVLSMLHLNPYSLSVCGQVIRSYYVVAVATVREYRRQGLMARVMEETFAELKREGVPFVFLLPVDEAIYRPFRFFTVSKFITRENPLYDLSYAEVRDRFDVYCVRDDLYERRLKAEDALAGTGEGEVLPDDPVMMLRITDREALSGVLSAAGCLSSGKLTEGSDGEDPLTGCLRKLRYYFREEV